MHPSPRLAVFSGPSLPPGDRVALPWISYLEPASRGDVERAAREYDAVLLIDGVFHHDLAPSPKECYAALERARMYGASSMGALRAAECAPYGFTPLGAIARWYASDVIDGDDEVAVLTHARTFEALTVPLVNVRYMAWLAHRRGLFDARERDAFVARLRRVFYMDRTLDDVIDAVPARVRDAVVAIACEEGDLKRHDARFALRTVLRQFERGTLAPIPHYAARAARRLVREAIVDTAPLRMPAVVPKAPGTYDRAVPFDQTLQLVPILRERYGITRVADTTHLDRTMIPTASAFVPHSPDLLGVYNGKGTTRNAAIASAVMEATERQIGAVVHLPVFRESLRVVAERIDLEACGLRARARDLVVDCVLGTELLSGDAIPVPLAMVQCPYFGETLFDVTTTNGLASGNNVTEAIYHAICELVERHSWTMAHVRCSLAPRFFGGASARDVALMPDIALPTRIPSIDGLVSAMRESGLIVRALLLDEAPLPVSVIATVTEERSDPPMAHMGLGCALSPAHALTRALTEAVQSRVVDIQAAREDLLRADEPARNTGEHGRRLKTLPTDQWYYDLPSHAVELSSIEDRTTEDLAEDLRRTLAAIRDYGIPSVVTVDLSPPDLPIAVVRAIVPGLETSMFTGHLGPRARAELNPFAVRR